MFCGTRCCLFCCASCLALSVPQGRACRCSLARLRPFVLRAVASRLCSCSIAACLAFTGVASCVIVAFTAFSSFLAPTVCPHRRTRRRAVCRRRCTRTTRTSGSANTLTRWVAVLWPVCCSLVISNLAWLSSASRWPHADRPVGSSMLSLSPCRSFVICGCCSFRHCVRRCCMLSASCFSLVVCLPSLAARIRTN